MRSIDVNTHLGIRRGQKNDSILIILTELRGTGLYQRRKLPWHVSLVFGSHLDIAWAAADLITAAAQATGSAELRQAADGFRRAARGPWGRAPAPSPPAPSSAPPPTCWPAARPSTGGPPSAAP